MDQLFHHGHPLTPSSGFAFRCDGCKTGGYISNGYYCITCDIWFHKECANEFPNEINHTSHPEHQLKKTNRVFWATLRCKVCRRRIEDSSFYRCYECSVKDFINLHMACAREPPPLTVNHRQAHEHPLMLFPISQKKKHICKVCQEKVVGKLGYRCFECKVVIHVKCVNSLEVDHPCHPKHSLKLITSGAPDYTDDACLLCGVNLEGMLYHCSLCNFSVCLGCALIPPSMDVVHLKTHEHKLTLMARKISFTCNACGMPGDRSPYFCLHCDFMVHRSCIGFPHIIKINRYIYRISHIQQLSFGDYICQICLERVNQFYGAYSCSKHINYVVHLQCATKNDVWNGIELEGIPEVTEDLTSFKKVGENLINHFSHEEHNLRLIKDGLTHDGSKRCGACMRPSYSDMVYSCLQCDFFLHETCANLSRKKQHMLHNEPFTLNVGDMNSTKIFPCRACGEYFNGFRYESGGNIFLDVGCILLSQFFVHENHEHVLHYNKTYTGKCNACNESTEAGAFSCESCDYNLDFRCASLPKTVKHSCDQHPLSLSCQKNANERYWCDICEEEMNLNEFFYTCNDGCEFSLHVKCVLGDFSRIKPGTVVELRQYNLEVILNNHSFRPICKICEFRCKAPFVLKQHGLGKFSFICSLRCFYGYLGIFAELLILLNSRVTKDYLKM